MSRVYVHTARYGKRNKRLIALLLLVLLLGGYFVGNRVYAQYRRVNQSPDSQISQPPAPLLGYITPYFLFKDTGKWLEDKANSTANRIIFEQYQAGTAARQLEVYVNQIPPPTLLATTRVLPVKVAGDSLVPGNLSGACGAALPAKQRTIAEISLAGSQMVCDPNASNFSVIMAQAGGNYQLKMVGSKIPESFVVIYRDYAASPDPNTVINIANSFRAV